MAVASTFCHFERLTSSVAAPRAAARSLPAAGPLGFVTLRGHVGVHFRQGCNRDKRHSRCTLSRGTSRQRVAPVRASIGGVGSFAAPKRLEVKVPGFLVSLKADDVDILSSTLDEAVAGGVTAVLLSEGAGGPGELYDSACTVRELLRGRAVLLLRDRTDIAAAAGAEGVVLSPSGLPIAVAARSLSGPVLIGKEVSDAASATSAAKEGASLLLISGKDTLSAVRGKISIPLFSAVGGSGVDDADLKEYVRAGADGASLFLRDLGSGESARAAAKRAVAALGGERQAPAAPAAREAEAQAEAAAPAAAPAAPGFRRSIISKEVQALISEQKASLERSVRVLEDVAPDLAEVKLLRDAAAGLEEPFLLVVAGEFNSGKSSAVNALLGGRFLTEGVLPTTNEISVLHYGGSPSATVRSETAADGRLDIYLPCEILQELAIVDTPGTNVILERQQRLTEEFIPRADLVLFVLSTDRPFTESEVSFLKYIRKWDKRVLFLLNKTDLLESQDELAEVVKFVSKSANSLLGVSDGVVFPVSSRLALRAKLEAAKSQGGAGSLGEPSAALAASDTWRQSGFRELEQFVLDFLGGGSSEKLRLKLLTPLNLAAALLDAGGRVLGVQAAAAAAEGAAAAAAEKQLEAFRSDMERDASIQRSRVRELVMAAAKRAESFVDSELRLQNVLTLQAFSGGGFEDVNARFMRDVVGQGMQELTEALREHSSWLARNSEQQNAYYSALVAERGAASGGFDNALTGEERRRLRARAASLQGGDKPKAKAPPAKGSEQVALALSEASVAAEKFDQRAAALLLREELRQVAFGVSATAAAAVFVAFSLMAAFQNPLEDIVALGLGGAAAYFSVLNLPLKRAEVKGKLRETAEAFADELEKALLEESTGSIQGTMAAVRKAVLPWAMAAADEAAAVVDAEQRRSGCEDAVRNLQARVRAL